MISEDRSDFNFTLMDDEKKALAFIEKIEMRQEALRRKSPSDSKKTITKSLK
jgi:hypothetical protein